MTQLIVYYVSFIADLISDCQGPECTSRPQWPWSASTLSLLDLSLRLAWTLFSPQVHKAPTAPGAQGDLSCHGTLAVGPLFVNAVLLSPFVPAEAK